MEFPLFCWHRGAIAPRYRCRTLPHRANASANTSQSTPALTGAGFVPAEECEGGQDRPSFKESAASLLTDWEGPYRGREQGPTLSAGPFLFLLACGLQEPVRRSDLDDHDVVVRRSGFVDGLENPVDHDLLIGSEREVRSTTECIEAERGDSDDDV